MCSFPDVLILHLNYTRAASSLEGSVPVALSSTRRPEVARLRRATHLASLPLTDKLVKLVTVMREELHR